MAVIRNRLNQRLIINFSGGKNIDLLAKGSVNVSEKELTSSHLQALLNNGDISVVQVSESQKDISVAQVNVSKKADASKKKDWKQKLTRGKYKTETHQR